MAYELKQKNPDKVFYFTDTLPVCPDMKLVTLEKVLHVLKTGENEVHMEADAAEETRRPLERMLELAR